MSLDAVQKKIHKLCADNNRHVADISVIAVSKMQPLDRIHDVLNAGHRLFGESRVQEAMEKWPALKNKYSDIQLHCIGHLQSNKLRDAVSLFDVIETVDRPSLAEALSAEMKKQNRHIPCFIQVNTGEEPQKGGINPKDLDTFYHYCTQDLRLNITGLMCIPPVSDVPDLHFALLHKISRAYHLKHLSMGMSGDYDRAIIYGATYLRIGSAIFGDRVEAAA